MNQITIEELSAYLPFKVKVKNTFTGTISTLRGISDRNNVMTYGDLCIGNFDTIKLLLRPLSQLTTEIEVNDEKFVPIERLEELYQQLGYDNYSFYFIMSYPKRLPYEIVQFLLSLHFDIFGLLNRNLADPIV